MREVCKVAERAHPRGPPLEQVGRRPPSRPLSGREEGALGGQDGIWIHLIRSEE